MFVEPAGEKKDVVLVYSVSHAMKIESFLKKAGCACSMVPVPRHLSSDCGVCVRFAHEIHSKVEDAIQQANLEVAGIFSLD